MSGNSERKLKGAELCPSCGGVNRGNEASVAENCYFSLKSNGEDTIGYLNCDIALRENGGEYEEIIEFELEYKVAGAGYVFGLVVELKCSICSMSFTSEHEIFKHFVTAYKRGRYTFSDS